MEIKWSDWRPFPDPRKGGILTAPFGPGCYELRHRDGRLVLFGTAGHVASRMTSLLPAPFGAGHRDNARKRTFVLDHLEDIEYRTSASETSGQAKVCERELKSSNTYIFPT
jgi:excinuclease UvrABC nuclease subunit